MKNIMSATKIHKKLTASFLAFIFFTTPLLSLAQEVPPPVSSPEAPTTQESAEPATPPSLYENFQELLDTPTFQEENSLPANNSSNELTLTEPNSEILPTPNETTPEPETNAIEESQSEKEPTEEEPPSMNLFDSSNEDEFGKEKNYKPKLAEVNNQNGALVYEYPINIPPGRNGMQPNLGFIFNSQDLESNMPVGANWSINIPYIEKINRTGVENLYIENYFTSSLFGELVLSTSTATSSYVTKIENGDFISWSYSSTTASSTWIATDKSGMTYKYGSATSTRQDDPNNTGKVFKWMLDEIRDKNDNYVKFQYYKDSGQIYPYKAVYTGNGAVDGIFEIEFLRESRTDNATSSKTGFIVITNYRINEVQVKINNSLVRKYALAYTTGGNTNKSLLNTITESGMDTGIATTTLPVTDIDYTPSTPAWGLDENWMAPVVVNSYNGGMFADINNDGFDDILIAQYHVNSGTSTRAAYVSNGQDGWTLNATYTPPFDFVSIDGSNTDLGARAIDLDGDGRTDLIRSSDNGADMAYLNTNTGWTSSGNYSPPVPFFGTDGVFHLTDINGDGLPDLIRAGDLCNPTCHTETTVYINEGVWSSDSGWTSPVTVDYPSGGLFTDVNGDELADILIASLEDDGTPTSTRAAYINNGQKNWVRDTNFDPPFDFVETEDSIDYGIRAMDVNGDGFNDLIRSRQGQTSKAAINTGKGWVENSSWLSPLNFVFDGEGQGNSTPTTYIVNLDGDALPDLIKVNAHTNGSCCVMYVYTSVAGRADLINKVTYPTGGNTSIAYKGSGEYFDGSNIANPDLPMMLDTVYQVTNSDGASSSYTSTFKYEQGDYYYTEVVDRRFSGFGKVSKTDEANNLSNTYFHQGNTTNSSQGEYDDHNSKIGKIYRTESYGNSNNLYSKTTHKWEKSSSSPNSLSHFVRQTQSVDFTYDGDSTHKDTAQNFTYSTSTGNLTEKIEWGEVTGSDDGTYSDTGSDKFTTTYTYATSSTTTLMSLLSGESTLDQSSNKVKESKYYYDNYSLGVADKGNVTKKEDWKTSSTYIDTERTFNSYGLVLTEKDPRDKTTAYVYDSNNLYIASSTNPVSHSTKFTYDYSSGKVATTTDANGNIFVNTYDGLDRLLEIKQPDPSATTTLLTRTGFTYTDTKNAFSIKKTDNLNTSTSTDTYIYLDGLGRKKQERVEAEGANYSVRDFEYNNIGLLQKESLPYFSAGSSTTTPTSTTTLYTNFSYDPLYRIKSTANAVGTTLTSYQDWKTTVTDPNGKVKDFYEDARKNLIKVDEKLVTSSSSTSTALSELSLSADPYLEGYWKLNGNSSDETSYARHGTDASSTYASAKFDNGASFSGGTTMQIKMTSFPANTANEPVSVFAWIKPNSFTDYTGIVSNQPISLGGWSLYTHGDGKLGTYTNAHRRGSTVLSTSTWTHVGFTFDGSTIVMYINGVEELVDSAATAGQTTAKLALGHFYYSYDSVTNFNGLIDDVSVFSRALTDEEVAEMYSTASNTYATYSTQYEYNYNRNLTKITDASNNVRNFTYDGLGRKLTAQDLHNISDGTYGTYTYTYDDTGNMNSKVDPKSQTVNYTYDDINRVLTEDYTGTGGTEVIYTYDTCTQGKGRLCNASSSSISIANAYNALGQLVISTSTISSTAYPTSYTYDRQGNQLTITNPDNSQVKYTHNNAGQIDAVQRKESSHGSYQDLVTDLDYGPHGQITYQENANCTATTNTYDDTKQYRLSNKRTYNACEEESLMGGSAPEEELTFELPSEPTEETTSTPPTIFFPPNPFESSYIGPIAPTSTDSSILPTPSSTPATTTSMTVDSTSSISLLNKSTRFLSKTWRAVTGGIEKTYNSIAQLFTAKTAHAAALELYDTPLFDDPDLEAYYRMENSPNDETANNYDGSGNGVGYTTGKFGNAMSLSGGTTARSDADNFPYHSANSTTSVAAWIFVSSRADYAGIMTTEPVSLGGWVLYSHGDGTIGTYTNNHRRSTTVLTNGTWYHVGFTFDGSTVKLYINGTEERSDSASTAGQTSAHFAIGNFYYGASGGTTSFNGRIDDAAVFSRVLTAQEMSKLYSGDWPATEVTGIQNFTYTYDANGNITKIVNSSSNNASSTVMYNYDDLNRLTNASTTAASTTPFNYSYSYDGLGNILTKTENGSATNYTYATNTTAYLNPHAALKIGSATSTYDNNGNLIGIITGGATTTAYTWDYNNKLTQASSTGVSVTYTYDPWGQRVKQTQGATTTIYSTKEYNITGSTPTKHIFLPDGTMIATIVGTGTTSTVSYIHSDHLGGTNVVTNDSGDVVQLLDYYPYGNGRLNERSGSFDEVRKFTNYERDDSVSLDYANARYYNYGNGKFISQDQAFLALGNNNQLRQITKQELNQFLANPQNLNSYSYALNNPLVNTDPTGQASTKAWLFNPLGTAFQVGGLRALSGAYTWTKPDTKFSSELFNRSLTLNPSNLTITQQGQYSNVISDIRNSQDYKTFVSKAIGEAHSQNALEFNYSYFGDKPGSQGTSINFTKDDLSTSIGGTLRTDISGKRLDNGLWSLNVAIQDRYNFDYHGYGYYKNNAFATTGNNAMLVPQATGAISNYQIDIKFKDIK